MNAHHRNLNLGYGSENATGESEKCYGKKMNSSWADNRVESLLHDSRPVTGTRPSLMEEMPLVVVWWEGFSFTTVEFHMKI